MGHSYYIIALRLLDYMGLAMEAKTEWKMRGGGTLSSPTALGLGISAPTHPSQISEFCLGLGVGKKVFYPPRPDYRRFKIPSFTSLSHTHSHVCAPTATFSFCRIVGNPLSSCRGEFNNASAFKRSLYWCQALHITNKDRYQSTSARRALALLNSPHIGIIMHYRIYSQYHKTHNII